jgi:light-harvesting complex 1 beta chain
MANYNNDKVPERWKNLFSNDEWFVHDIVVKSSWAFLVVAIIAHILVLLWKPWF